MKKISTLCLILVSTLCLNVMAASVTTPESGKKYYLIQPGGNFLAEVSGVVELDNPGSTTNHIFQFVPVEGSAGVYNIEVLSTGTFITKSGTWSTVFGSDQTVNAAKFTIEAVGDGTVKFNCLDNSLYLGTDATESGSLLYSNKGGNDPKHYWYIQEATEGEIVLFGLNTVISAAETLKAASVVGTDFGDYLQKDMDTFTAAITAAKAVAANPASQAAANDATTALNQAISAFKATVIKPVFIPDVNKYYYLIHSSGMYMTESSTTVKLNTPLGTNIQYFKFIPVAGRSGVYTIQVGSTSSFITKSGSYNVVLGTDTTSNLSKFSIEVVDGTTSTLKFKCLDNSRYLGTDASTAGSGIYSDKSGTSTLLQWSAKVVVEGELIKSSLSDALTAATKLINKAVIGNEPTQYPQEAYTAFSDAITSATNVLNQATAQADINTAYAALIAAQAAFTDARIDPVFIPVDGAKYRVINKYYNKCITVNGDNTVSATGWATAFTSGLATQCWTFKPVAGLSGIYQMLNNDQAFTYTAAAGSYGITLSTPDASAATQQIKFVYYGTENGQDLFVVQSSDETLDLVVSGSTRARMLAKNLTDAGHRTLLLKVDEPNDPDKRALADYIYTAQTTLDSKVIGTGEGQWTQDAYDTFNNVIKSCISMVNGSGYTQAEVDAKLVDLKAAETVYNNPSAINTKVLTAKLDTANIKLNAAVVGEKIGEYLMSTIEQFKLNIDSAAIICKKAAKQADIDTATVTLQTKIDTFVADSNHVVLNVKVVIDDVLPYAQALKDSAKVGTEKGQYDQSAIDLFQVSIDKAKGLQTPASADLDSLLQAMATFKASAISINRNGLKSTIDAATALLGTIVTGTFDGQYPAAKINELKTALASANQLYASTSITQLKIDSVNTVLGNAINTLNAAKIVISFTGLSTAISNANSALNNAVIGNSPEQYKQEVFDALKSKLTSATPFNNSKQVSQTSVDSVATSLTAAIKLFLASVNPKDFSALKTIIDQAQAAYNQAVIGNYQGAYSKTTKDAFKKSIDNAMTVYKDSTTTQAAINEATTKLTSLLSNFNVLYVKVDKSALLTKLTAMKAFLDSVKVDRYTAESFAAFRVQVESSQSVYNDAYASQSNVDYSLSLLNSSEKALVLVTAIGQVATSAVTVYTSGADLHIINIPEKSHLTICNLAGQLLLETNCTTDHVTQTVKAGTYVIAVRNANVLTSTVVLVK
ncbi:MAG: hypothetical protein Q8914_01935 [Bacteroidota bacterium]|nr:hypothetical protein [Bacteroidota bacterium]